MNPLETPFAQVDRLPYPNMVVIHHSDKVDIGGDQDTLQNSDILAVFDVAALDLSTAHPNRLKSESIQSYTTYIDDSKGGPKIPFPQTYVTGANVIVGYSPKFGKPIIIKLLSEKNENITRDLELHNHSKAEHPHIAKIYQGSSRIEINGTNYVMSIVEAGVTTVERQPLSLVQTLALVDQMAYTLDYCVVKLKTVYPDLKPENIILAHYDISTHLRTYAPTKIPYFKLIDLADLLWLDTMELCAVTLAFSPPEALLQYEIDFKRNSQAYTALDKNLVQRIHPYQLAKLTLANLYTSSTPSHHTIAGHFTGYNPKATESEKLAYKTNPLGMHIINPSGAALEKMGIYVLPEISDGVSNTPDPRIMNVILRNLNRDPADRDEWCADYARDLHNAVNEVLASRQP